MRCISLWQPWATLLVSGQKKIETREWNIMTPGPLLIHATKRWNSKLSALSRREPFYSALKSIGVTWKLGDGDHTGLAMSKPSIPFGALVGCVNVQDSGPVEMFLVQSPEKEFGDFSPGRFGWRCTNPVMFQRPIPFCGQQKFFGVANELLKDIPELRGLVAA